MSEFLKTSPVRLADSNQSLLSNAMSSRRRFLPAYGYEAGMEHLAHANMMVHRNWAYASTSIFVVAAILEYVRRI
jgi:hypothetical protein